MEQPLGPGASARCPGPVHCVLDLGGFLVAFHSDSACNVFEPDTLRVAYRTSQAETHGAHAQGSAVVTVGHEGSARLLTALEGSVEARELHLAGLQRSRAVAVGPHGVAIAAASTRELLIFDSSHSLQKSIALEGKAVIKQLAWAGANLVGSRRGFDGAGVFRWAAGDLTDAPALQESDDNVTCLEVSPSGRLVAAGGTDAQVRIWELPEDPTSAAPIVLAHQLGHDATVQQLSWDATSQLLAVSDGATVLIWDVSRPKQPVKCFGHQPSARLTSVAFHGQKHLLATAADKGQVVVYDTSGLQPGSPLEPLRRLSVSATAACSDVVVTSVTWMGDAGVTGEEQLAASTEGGWIHTWHISSTSGEPTAAEQPTQELQSLTQQQACVQPAAAPLRNGELVAAKAAAHRAVAAAVLANGHATNEELSRAASTSAAGKSYAQALHDSATADAHCNGCAFDHSSGADTEKASHVDVSDTLAPGTGDAALASSSAAHDDTQQLLACVNQDGNEPAHLAPGDEGVSSSSDRNGLRKHSFDSEVLSDSSQPGGQQPQPPLTPTPTPPGSSGKRVKRGSRRNRSMSQNSLGTTSTISDFAQGQRWPSGNKMQEQAAAAAAAAAAASWSPPMHPGPIQMFPVHMMHNGMHPVMMHPGCPQPFMMQGGPPMFMGPVLMSPPPMAPWGAPYPPAASPFPRPPLMRVHSQPQVHRGFMPQASWPPGGLHTPPQSPSGLPPLPPQQQQQQQQHAHLQHHHHQQQQQQGGEYAQDTPLLSPSSTYDDLVRASSSMSTANGGTPGTSSGTPSKRGGSSTRRGTRGRGTRGGRQVSSRSSPATSDESPEDMSECSSLKTSAGDGAMERGVPAVEAATPVTTVYVGNLATSVQEHTLCAAFSCFGLILQCEVVRERLNRESRGFAFLTFAYASCAASAMVNMDGAVLGGPFGDLQLKVRPSARDQQLQMQQVSARAQAHPQMRTRSVSTGHLQRHHEQHSGTHAGTAADGQPRRLFPPSPSSQSQNGALPPSSSGVARPSTRVLSADQQTQLDLSAAKRHLAAEQKLQLQERARQAAASSAAALEGLVPVHRPSTASAGPRGARPPLSSPSMPRTLSAVLAAEPAEATGSTIRPEDTAATQAATAAQSRQAAADAPPDAASAAVADLAAAAVAKMHLIGAAAASDSADAAASVDSLQEASTA